MADANNKQPIIIKKKKAGGHGHHGGAWKVAYADMVTALMAFFLVMWICNLDVKTRLGIAEYFTSPSVYGPYTPSSWFSLKFGGVPRLTQGNLEQSKEVGGDPLSEGLLRIDPLPSDNFTQEIAKRYAAVIQSIISNTPAFSEFKDYVVVEVTNEGLRVELMEGERPRFFAPGTAVWTASGKRIAEFLASVLVPVQHLTTFEGHTTGKPETRGITTKWELGSDRALALRQIFSESGLATDQVKQILSLGDQNLRFPDRNDPRNLRIAVLVPYSSQDLKIRLPPH
jgi:chemotaxis protein MotB